MKFQENISLKPFNSFGIDARARFFASFQSKQELEELLIHNIHPPLIILGGGSNLLFTKDFDGLVAKNELKGIELVSADENYYYVKAAAGENWHRFVLYCIAQNYAGLENLSLIPGNVGASPIQNIGAYGVEIKDVFDSLEAYHIEEKTTHHFSLADCGFGYRESVFKKQYRKRFVILSVTFRLAKQPVFHTGYGAIEQELVKMQVSTLTAKAISDAVIRIRSSKLPDPAITGNAGSFFKNPVVPEKLFEDIRQVHSDVPGFTAGPGLVKIPAGWLIEKSGWKGYRKGDAGCYEKQALVLVNYGAATGGEIFELSENIINSVFTRFGVTLEREVNIL